MLELNLDPWEGGRQGFRQSLEKVLTGNIARDGGEGTGREEKIKARQGNVVHGKVRCGNARQVGRQVGR